MSGFGIIIILMLFHFSGKCLIRRQQLNNLVIWRIVLSENVFKALLGIPLKPNALLDGKFLIIFLISPGEISEINFSADTLKV